MPEDHADISSDDLMRGECDRLVQAWKKSLEDAQADARKWRERAETHERDNFMLYRQIRAAYADFGTAHAEMIVLKKKLSESESNIERLTGHNASRFEAMVDRVRELEKAIEVVRSAVLTC